MSYLKQAALLGKAVQDALDTLHMVLDVAKQVQLPVGMVVYPHMEVSRAFPWPRVGIPTGLMELQTARHQKIHKSLLGAVDALNTATMAAWEANLLVLVNVQTLPTLVAGQHYDGQLVQALTFLDTRRITWQKT